MRAYDELVSYIALSAPATRRPGTGDEPFLRPEFGFTPKWYRDAVGVDFGERWHLDPEYRRTALVAMAREVRRRFPALPIGQVEDPEAPADLLTGIYGASFVALLYGIPIEYQGDNWPWSARRAPRWAGRGSAAATRPGPQSRVRRADAAGGLDRA